LSRALGNAVSFSGL